MEIVTVSLEQKRKLLQEYNVTEKEILEDIEIIKEWKLKQPHLPKNLSDDFIRRILTRNKFRVERTKQKLDNYFTLRGQNQELIRDFEYILPSKICNTYLPMPNLTPNFERIVIMKLVDPNPDLYDLIEIIKLDLAVTELTLQYDDSIAVRYLFDFNGFTLRHLTKWNPLIITKHIHLIEKAYSWRMCGIELVNFPDFANKILGVLKLILRPKLYQRIKIHKNMDTVYEVMPRDCLPKEYGGSCSTIPDLLKKWDQAFKEHHNFFVENYNNIAQEELRIIDKQDDDDFGPQGTFKKLSID